MLNLLASSESGPLHPGELVPHSGIYRAHHRAHRLPHNVYVNAGTRLPVCQRCGSDVEFSLLVAGSDLATDYDFSERNEDAVPA